MKKIINIPYTWEDEDQYEALRLKRKALHTKIMVALAVLVLSLFLLRGICGANEVIIIKGYSNTQICEAIRRAENSKTHPYGIMVKYKHTTPKQACLNTIRSARARWNGQGDFIVFLGKTYSPPSINPNWVRLVRYFLNKDNHGKT